MLGNVKSLVLQIHICQIKCLCSGFHPNLFVKIYQLLKKLILNVHIVLEDM
jgi:hypothetical protein